MALNMNGMKKPYTGLLLQKAGKSNPLKKSMQKKLLQVFEFDKIRVDGERFKESHFKQLVLYNEKHGDKFFTVGHRSIRFSQYVGVIQAGNLTIEILPKADRSSNEKEKWRRALVAMLRECGYLRLESLTNAYLRLRSASLVDLYFETFLNLVSELAHMGLTKKYRFEKYNKPVLKGRLVISEHVRKNIVHRERFVTSQQVYNRNNIYNQILKKALSILQKISSSPDITARTKQMLLIFEEVDDVPVNLDTFERVIFNRKTVWYKDAVTLAKLIILQYAPDLKQGGEDVLAILFDMNKLFEKFVYVQLKKNELKFASNKLRVLGQSTRKFWGNKTIRPDIVLEFHSGQGGVRLILDTKWKVLDSLLPSDEDLKQMYVYNLHYNASNSLLIYPKVILESTPPKAFHPSDAVNKDHSCQLYFLDIFENDLINKNIGHEFLTEILDYTKQLEMKGILL